MFQYERHILKCQKKRYANSTVHDKNFMESYKNSRLRFIIKSINNFKSKDLITLKSNDKILNYFQKIYKKNRINNSDFKNLFNYYKKFNIHLRLLNKNKKKTNYLSYLYLGYFVVKLKYINELQKLNCILKIIDKVSLEKRINLSFVEFSILIILIKFEKSCLKKI